MIGRMLLLLLLVPYGIWLVLAYRYHFLDGVNLLFHEAGHAVFGILGQHMHFLGGTLGQLFFPAATAVHFAVRDRLFDASVCMLWLGESLMYAGEYAGDAKLQVLPLVGGHVHDWHWLLSRWGVLPHAELVGTLFHVLGSALVIGALLAAALLVRREQREG